MLESFLWHLDLQLFVCRSLYFLPPSLSSSLPPFFSPASLLSSLPHFLSFPLKTSPRSCTNCLRVTQGLLLGSLTPGTFGSCTGGHWVWAVRGTHGGLKQSTVSLPLQEAGQSQHRTTAATEMRDWWGQEILKSCARDADTDGFEEMNRSYQADKSWQVGGLQVERRTYGKKPARETMGCIQRPISSSLLTEHKM